MGTIAQTESQRSETTMSGVRIVRDDSPIELPDGTPATRIGWVVTVDNWIVGGTVHDLGEAMTNLLAYEKWTESERQEWRTRHEARMARALAAV